MEIEEFYSIYINGNWKEDVETEEELKEEIEYWINHNDYLEDELLDLCFEAVVSTISIKFITKKK